MYTLATHSQLILTIYTHNVYSQFILETYARNLYSQLLIATCICDPYMLFRQIIHTCYSEKLFFQVNLQFIIQVISQVIS